MVKIDKEERRTEERNGERCVRERIGVRRAL